MTPEEAIIRAAEISSSATVKGVIWGTGFGAGIGFFTQWFMSNKNHKSELERIRYKQNREELMEYKVVLTKIASIGISNKLMTAAQAKERLFQNLEENLDNLNRFSHCLNDDEEITKKLKELDDFLKNYFPEPETFFIVSGEFIVKYANIVKTTEETVKKIDALLRS